MKARTISERDNYLRALEFRNPEWIPAAVSLAPSVWLRHGRNLEALVARHPRVFGPRAMRAVDFHASPNMHRAGEHYRDAWGCVWYCAREGNLGQPVEHPLADWRMLSAYTPPDPLEQLDWKSLEGRAEDLRREGELVTGGATSMEDGCTFFDRLQFLRGCENLLVDLLEEPPELERLIELVLDYNMSFIRKWLDIGVDLMYFHSDIGTQRGLMMSAEVFRKHLKPAYMKMFSACRKAGTHVFYSSDGCLLQVVDDLVECGASMHDPQVRANTLPGIVTAYKGKLCAKVDIDQQMLPFCTPGEARAAIRDVVKAFDSPEGGLMIYLEPSSDVPLETIDAACLAVEEFCL